MSTGLRVGITDVPNDLYLFDAYRQAEVAGPPISDVQTMDLEALNREARTGSFDLIKISFSSFVHFADRYDLLPVGSALVNVGGPIIVSKAARITPAKCSLAIPGKGTTAYLLTTLLGPFSKVMEVPYADIPHMVAAGDADCGLLIHESSFDIEALGLQTVTRLMDVWKEHAGFDLPLGGLAFKKDHPASLRDQVVCTLRQSLRSARRQHDAVVTRIHDRGSMTRQEICTCIDYWVNDETERLSKDGRAALCQLLKLAAEVYNVPQRPWEESIVADGWRQ